MKTQFANLCAAWIFLTRIALPPMRLTEDNFAEAPAYYPLVGILIGGMGAAGYFAGHYIAGPPTGALLALAATLLATGAFHEDGLADTFDGLGAQSRDRMLEVMRDSRIGTFGAVALFTVLGLKVVSLADMPAIVAAAALALVHGLSRLSAVGVIATSQYARSEGTAKPVAKGISRRALMISSATGLLAIGIFASLFSIGLALAALCGLFIGHIAARILFERRLGGYTGDCLGAVQQLSELGAYLALVIWL
ncbi:MAG: adenosylcobinamide-GDP ribazoletransferase [Pseudomonadota bacterium]